MVMPALASVFSKFIILRAVELSRPLVGSSRRISCGSVISSYPIQVLFLSPPEIDLSVNPPILVFWHDCSWSRSIICWDFSLIYSVFRDVLSFAAKQKLSKGVRVSIKMSSYMTNAPSFPNWPAWSSWPLMQIVPLTLHYLLTSNLYPRTLRRLVFPDPLAPIMPTSSPGLAYPVTSLSTYLRLLSS